MIKKANPILKLCGVGVVLALILAGLFAWPLVSSAQSDGGFDKKADARLQRVYREFSQTKPQSEAAMTEARRAERQSLRERIRLEERDGVTRVGVIATLRMGNEEALAAAQTAIETAGFNVRTRAGNLVVLTVAVDELPRLAELKIIESLAAAGFSKPLKAEIVSPKKLGKRFLRNDQANVAAKAPEARTTYSVTGKGVVVGVIDSGIDWRHGDFKKADGNTRIKMLWDMSDAANSGPGSVGKVFTETELNNALAGNGTVGEKDTSNHGSHVAGIAAGNGTLQGGNFGAFAGIAPEADLIIVKANRAGSSTFGDDDQIAALNWIRDQAQTLNAPFVINMSLGGHFSQHDGTETVEKAIDTLLQPNAALKGRQVVIAAGNEGAEPIHAGGVLAQGATATIPFTLSSQAKALVGVFAGTDTINITVEKPNGSKLTLTSPATSASDDDVEIEVSASTTGNNARNLGIAFKKTTAGTWKLTLAGAQILNGRWDVWDIGDGAIQIDNSVRDGLMHVGSPATAREAIAAANFVSKTSFASQSGTTNKSGEGTLGNAANSSSTGPTRDGRIKPEIGAPGAYVLSVLSADTNPAPDPDDVAPDGKHVAYTGTSMATPVTAGVIALMLQANPNLEPGKIKRLLRRTVTNDTATGASISHKFGYGKINALEAVKAVKDNLFASEFVSVNGASFVPDNVASGAAIMSGFGTNLAASTVNATGGQALPTTLGNVQVRITDKNAVARLAQLFFVSAQQINYLVPADTAEGAALTEVLRDGNVVARGSISVTKVWPGLFTAAQSGSGQGVGNVLRIKPGATQPIYESALNPIDLGIAGDKVFLELYGTGIRNKTGPNENPTAVKAYFGGVPLTVTYAGNQSEFFGLDQVNVELPSSLAGRNATLDLVLSVDGRVVNTISFKVK